jgi:hypothetical protein
MDVVYLGSNRQRYPRLSGAVSLSLRLDIGERAALLSQPRSNLHRFAHAALQIDARI